MFNTFHVYGLMIGLAVVAGLWVIERKEKELDSFLVFFVLSFALVGARVYHLVTDWSFYADASFFEVIAVWNGGLGIFGAIVGGILGIVLYLLYRQKPLERIWRYTDLFALALPLGQAVGRWGNFVNNEIQGVLLGNSILERFAKSQLGIDKHPLFLYESLAMFFIWLLLDYAQTHAHLRIGTGKILGIYIFAYGVVRFFLENFRQERAYLFSSMFLNGQVAGLFAMMIGGAILLLRRKKT